MMKLKEMLHMGTDTLLKSGITDYRTDAWYLLSYCMGDIRRSEYYMREEEIVPEELTGRYFELIDERAGHKPLQYITGSQEFMGIDISVNESVLIPRQDTEVLAELAIEHADEKRVIDMCTGSGCIAVSIALLSKPSTVTAVDISEAALKVAVKNAEDNGAKIHFIHSDMWENVVGEYDIIVSNPPYITDAEMEELMPEVRIYEPETALRAGPCGLDCYRRLISGAGEHLSCDGIIMMEIGCAQAEAVSELLEQNDFKNIRIKKDLAGLDRVVYAVKS